MNLTQEILYMNFRCHKNDYIEMVWEQTQSIYHNVGSFSEIKLFQELTFFWNSFCLVR